jgi:penicillin V acylase-like amidase (Ntn superfamily)
LGGYQPSGLDWLIDRTSTRRSPAANRASTSVMTGVRHRIRSLTVPLSVRSQSTDGPGRRACTHWAKIVILADDDRTLREAMSPEVVVRSLTESKIESMGGLAASALEPGGQAPGQVGVDQESQAAVMPR